MHSYTTLGEDISTGSNKEEAITSGIPIPQLHIPAPSDTIYWVVYILFVVFGLGMQYLGFCALHLVAGTWIIINGVFAELPIFFQTLPEGYAIAAYMVQLQSHSLANAL